MLHPCTRLSPRFIDAIHCYSLLDVNNNPTWYDISETMRNSENICNYVDYFEVYITDFLLVSK